MTPLRFRDGTVDYAQSTQDEHVDLVFPRLTNRRFASSPEIAQVIHVPKDVTTLIVQVPMTFSMSSSLNGLTRTYDYTLSYTTPSGTKTTTTTLNRQYTYKYTQAVRVDSALFKPTLKRVTSSISQKYGLTGSWVFGCNDAVNAGSSELSETGGVRYSIFEFNANITAGWYWLVLPTRLDFVSFSTYDLDKVATTIKSAIARDAAAVILGLQQSGYNILSWDYSFYDTDASKNLVKSRILQDAQQSIDTSIGFTMLDGFIPTGLGEDSYVESGITMFLADRLDTGSFAGTAKPGFAVSTSTSWTFPEDERYLLLKLQTNPEDTDFDVDIRFSLDGDLHDDTVWTSWESLLEDTGWNSTGIKEDISLIDRDLGGENRPGEKTLYTQIRRRVKVGSVIESQYHVYRTTIYYLGVSPVLTAVRAWYVMDM